MRLRLLRQSPKVSRYPQAAQRTSLFILVSCLVLLFQATHCHEPIAERVPRPLPDDANDLRFSLFDPASTTTFRRRSITCMPERVS